MRSEEIADDERPSLLERTAIVGMACRFPGGVSTPDGFWQLLVDGRDAIGEIPPDRARLLGAYDADPARPGYHNSRRGGFLGDVAGFDAGFFGMSGREAVHVDPQHRLLLEMAYEAFEDAGVPVESVAGSRTGVFVGISWQDYGYIQYSPANGPQIDGHTNTGVALSMAANRISYAFDLRGPSFAVDTACSSSLTAVHVAVSSLRRHECDIAVVGGIQLVLVPEVTIGFGKAHMLSPDCRCAAFDARANGYVRSEGGAVVVLKDLDSAISAGDRIYAVVAGSAINEDGRTIGITVPSLPAQQAVVRAALADAGVDAGEVGYVEAHGTGTPVGDPIEAASLGAVLAPAMGPDQWCAVGSVKTNIGHLESASGMAGLCKAALAVHHRQIPKSLHFSTPNPEIDFEVLRLRVVTELEPWPAGRPMVVGVNSFGFGGANAHVVLVEAPGAPVAPVVPLVPAAGSGPPAGEERPEADVLVVSARSQAALGDNARAMASYLRGAPSPLAEVCRTAARRRSQHEHRIAAVASGREEMAELLAAVAGGERRAAATRGRRPAGDLPVAFVFSGMGPQWWGMAHQLMGSEAVFAKMISRCDDALQGLAPWSLVEELLRDEATSRVAAPELAHVTNFAVQLALVALWEQWGICPSAVVGHSGGEMAAAYTSGALRLEDAMAVTWHRSRLSAQAAGKGRMLAAGVSRAEAEALISGVEGQVEMAAVNSPGAVTLAGDEGALTELARRLDAQGRFCRLLDVTVPYHSRHMDPIRDELLASLRAVRAGSTTVPMASAVTGEWIAGTELGAGYWWGSVRHPVLFASAIETLLASGYRTFLEIAPHPVLSQSVTECLAARGDDGVVLPSLRRREDDRATMLRTAGALWAHGAPVDWAPVVGEGPAAACLPHYRWARERYWFESRPVGSEPVAEAGGIGEHPLLGHRVRAVHPLWEARLDQEALDWLRDHVVEGTPIHPGAAFVEAALAAARLLGESAPAVRDLDLRRALVRGSGSATLTHCSVLDGAIAFHSRACDSAAEWEKNATARLAASGSRPGRVDLDELRAGCSVAVDTDQLYRQLRERQLGYGPAFRVVTSAWRGTREAVGVVSLPSTSASASLPVSASASASDEGYLVHPALLDGAFQLIFAAAGDDIDGLYLPVAIDRVETWADVGRSCWVHARIGDDQGSGDGEIVAAVDLLDDEGQVLVAVHGLRLHRLHDRAPSGVADDWFYQLRWQAPEESVARSGPPTQKWAVVGAGPVAEALRDHLATVDALAGVGVTGADGVVLVATAGTAPDAAPGAPELFAALLDGCQELLELARGLRVPPARGVYVVTGGAQAVDGDGLLDLARSPLWGLVRVAAREQPEVGWRLVDLAPSPAPADIAALAQVLLGAGGEDETAIRNGQRLLRRLERMAPAVVAPLRGGAPRGEGWRGAVSRPGALETFALRAVSRRPPGHGQVEVEVEVAGLNFRDVMMALGRYPSRASDGKHHRYLGLDLAGRVVRCGPGVTELTAGDEVFGVGQGALGSHVTMAASLVTARPPGVASIAAAGCPVAFTTALYGLNHQARLAPGERVLIHAATGGVGLAALQVARRAGAEILATAGSDEKRAMLHSLGVEHVFNSRSTDFADGVLDVTDGRGVDVVLNSLAGEAIPRGIGVLATFGRFVELGKRDIYDDASIGMLAFRRNLSFFAVDLELLVRERPAVFGTLLKELAVLLAGGSFRPLPTTAFAVSETAAAFRFMSQARHTGKVVIPISGAPVEMERSPTSVPLCRADGSYVVTGGTRGFGLAAARWLAAQGAGAVVIVGRHAPGAEIMEQLHAGVSDATTIVSMTGDIGVNDDVARILGQVRATLHPIRGVLHAAVVLDDCVLPDLDRERLVRNMHAKVLGAWHLHELTADDPLDLFVSFSSIVAVLGNGAQGGYAAANAFLDALAHHRRALGRPALTVDWGVISDTGMVARNAELAKYLDGQGFAALTAERALGALDRLLRQGEAQAMVGSFDWRRRLSASEAASGARGQSSLTDHLAPAAGAPAAPVRDELARLLARAEHERFPAVVEYVRTQLGHLLGIDPGGIELDRTLPSLGLDSLIVVELTTVVHQHLGVDLPIVGLLRGVTVADLGRLVLDRAEALTTPAAPATPSAAATFAAPPGHRSTPAATNGIGAAAPPAAVPSPSRYARLDYGRWSPRQRVVRRSLAAALRSVASVDIAGGHHLTASGPFILAANHLHVIDLPVVITLAPRPIICLAASTFRRYRVLDWFLSDVTNAIYVERGVGDQNAIEQGLTVLRAGGRIGLAPEGRVSPTGALQKGQSGVAYLAAWGQAPVIPMAMWGQEALRECRPGHRAPVHIRIGEPLAPPIGTSIGNLVAFTDTVMTAIAALLPEPYRGLYADRGGAAIAGNGALPKPGCVVR